MDEGNGTEPPLIVARPSPLVVHAKHHVLAESMGRGNHVIDTKELCLLLLLFHALDHVAYRVKEIVARAPSTRPGFRALSRGFRFRRFGQVALKSPQAFRDIRTAARKIETIERRPLARPTMLARRVAQAR
jgi:hypothetical protein